jgi:hypothetical protein
VGDDGLWMGVQERAHQAVPGALVPDEDAERPNLRELQAIVPPLHRCVGHATHERLASTVSFVGTIGLVSAMN